MRTKPVAVEDQYRLIMECRASGITDYQWCIEHDNQTRHILQLGKAFPPKRDKSSYKWRGRKISQAGSGKA